MNIQEVILCKFGEVILKGANRQTFESQLLKELRRRASPYGTFKIYFKQSTVYVEPTDELPPLNSHEGQEFNYIIEGKMLFKIGEITYELSEGDSVYFDSGVPHAEKALDGKKARFIAVVMK